MTVCLHTPELSVSLALCGSAASIQSRSKPQTTVYKSKERNSFQMKWTVPSWNRKNFLCFNESPHTASHLLYMERARNWYDRVNAVNYQQWLTWSCHLALLSLAELLHNHNKCCHASYKGQKLPRPMSGKETLFHLALKHARAHLGTHREHGCSMLL